MGTEEKARVVIDTNVFISAILFGGLPAQVLTLCQKGEIIPLISLPVLEEYIHTVNGIMMFTVKELLEKRLY